MEEKERASNMLVASPGMYIANADRSVISKLVYLGKYDNPGNYTEITEEEYNNSILAASEKDKNEALKILGIQ
jgi:hypothetical protein